MKSLMVQSFLGDFDSKAFSDILFQIFLANFFDCLPHEDIDGRGHRFRLITDG